MIIQSTRFGEVEVQKEKVITFPEGILGFMDTKEYVLIDHSPGSPIQWLQAVREPELAFVVMDPLLFKPDYKVSLHPDDLSVLEVEDVKNLFILTIITIPTGHPEQMTANLKGPIVIHIKNGLAKQMVLYDAAYTTRYPVHENRPQKSPDALGESMEVRS